MTNDLGGRPICLLSSMLYSQEGGIQRVTQMVLRVLREAWPRVPVQLFSLHDSASVPVAAAGRNGKYEAVTFLPFGSDRLRYGCGVVRALVERKPALVISDHAHLNILPSLARFVTTFPWISFVYHAELLDLSLMRRRALRQTNLVLAISEFSAREARRILGPEHALEICHLGLFPDYPDWAKMSQSLPARLVNRRVILIVGRMAGGERDKGHEALIRAMPAVARRTPNALLVIVGRGADEARLRRLTEELGVGSHVHFAGYVPDPELPSYYEACEVFAMPSFGEGFGLVYLEAMFHARPCLAGNRDAAHEIVRQGETGLLVEPGNVSQVEQALTRLLQDRLLAERLGQGGRARLDEAFRYEHFRGRLQKALARFEPLS
jgi:glycosyltransferase involved in cell wall biosynthesis